MERGDFWEEVGRLMARILPPDDDGSWLVDCWFTVGEEYRLSGRSPASLVAAIVAVGLKPTPQ